MLCQLPRIMSGTLSTIVLFISQTEQTLHLMQRQIRCTHCSHRHRHRNFRHQHVIPFWTRNYMCVMDFNECYLPYIFHPAIRLRGNLISLEWELITNKHKCVPFSTILCILSTLSLSTDNDENRGYVYLSVHNILDLCYYACHDFF